MEKSVLIQIPMLVAGVLNNVLVKVILSVIVLYKSGKACYAAYAATPALIARSMPFIINNTPLALVRTANAVLNLKELAYEGIITILLFSLAGQQIILRLLPEIPHVTPMARRLKIWSVIVLVTNSPQTIFDFAWGTAGNAAIFTWSNCTELANSIEGRARQASDERMAICKAKALQVWQTIMIEQKPAL